ncbi:hypothetical protein ACOMHN_007992 [Nucella lapillus]
MDQVSPSFQKLPVYPQEEEPAGIEPNLRQIISYLRSSERKMDVLETILRELTGDIVEIKAMLGRSRNYRFQGPMSITGLQICDGGSNHLTVNNTPDTKRHGGFQPGGFQPGGFQPGVAEKGRPTSPSPDEKARTFSQGYQYNQDYQHGQNFHDASYEDIDDGGVISGLSGQSDTDLSDVDSCSISESSSFDQGTTIEMFPQSNDVSQIAMERSGELKASMERSGELKASMERSGELKASTNLADGVGVAGDTSLAHILRTDMSPETGVEAGRTAGPHDRARSQTCAQSGTGARSQTCAQSGTGAMSQTCAQSGTGAASSARWGQTALMQGRSGSLFPAPPANGSYSQGNSMRDGQTSLNKSKFGHLNIRITDDISSEDIMSMKGRKDGGIQGPLRFHADDMESTWSMGNSTRPLSPSSFGSLQNGNNTNGAERPPCASLDSDPSQEKSTRYLTTGCSGSAQMASDQPECEGSFSSRVPSSVHSVSATAPDDAQGGDGRKGVEGPFTATLSDSAKAVNGMTSACATSSQCAAADNDCGKGNDASVSIAFSGSCDGKKFKGSATFSSSDLLPAADPLQFEGSENAISVNSGKSDGGTKCRKEVSLTDVSKSGTGMKEYEELGPAFPFEAGKSDSGMTECAGSVSDALFGVMDNDKGMETKNKEPANAVSADCTDWKLECEQPTCALLPGCGKAGDGPEKRRCVSASVTRPRPAEGGVEKSEHYTPFISCEGRGGRRPVSTSPPAPRHTRVDWAEPGRLVPAVLCGDGWAGARDCVSAWFSPLTPRCEEPRDSVMGMAMTQRPPLPCPVTPCPVTPCPVTPCPVTQRPPLPCPVQCLGDDVDVSEDSLSATSVPHSA